MRPASPFTVTHSGNSIEGNKLNWYEAVVSEKKLRLYIVYAGVWIANQEPEP